MINLLPTQEKRKLRKEFLTRFGVVVLCALFVLEFLGSLVLVPSDLVINTRVAALSQELAEKKKQMLPGTADAQSKLDQVKKEIALLKGGDTGADIPPSKILSNILAQKPAGIVITRFSYLRSAPGASVQLAGVADTREDLIQFQKLLSKKEDNPNFSEVKYGQNFLLKKSDISFGLTITVN